MRPSVRYPRYVCQECASRAQSPNGYPLAFFTLSLSGGYGAVYADSKETYESHYCMIDGVPCYTDEARFGGIVIQVVGN